MLSADDAETIAGGESVRKENGIQICGQVAGVGQSRQSWMDGGCGVDKIVGTGAVLAASTGVVLVASTRAVLAASTEARLAARVKD